MTGDWYSPTVEIVAGVLALVAGVLLIQFRAPLARWERKWPRALRIWKTRKALRRWHVLQAAVAIAFGAASVLDALRRSGMF